MLEVYNLEYDLLAILDDNSRDAAHHIILTENLNGIDTVSFRIPMNSSKWQHLINENLVKYQGQFYFIKVPTFIDSLSQESVTVTCEHLASGLKNQLNGTLFFSAKNAKEIIEDILAERVFGWNLDTVDIDYNPSLLREFSTKDQSVFSNLVRVAEIFEAFLLFDSNTRKVKLKQSLPDRNIELRKGVNLQSVNLAYETDQMVTRLYPFGAKDIVGQDVNITSVTTGNVSYLDNFDYFLDQGYTQIYIDAHPELFMHEMIWRQPTYYSASDLKDDAESKLDVISQPIVRVNLSALDLSSLPQFFAISPILGEFVTIIDEDLNLNVKAQVVSVQRSSESPIALNIQISNEIVYSSILQGLVRNDKLINGSANEPTGELSGFHIKAKTVSADKIQVGEARTIALYARGSSTNTSPTTRKLALDAVDETIPLVQGFTVVVINRADYNVDSATNYDTFSVPADLTAMASALNALGSSKIVVILSQGQTKVDDALITEMERCGSSTITKTYIDAHPDTPYAMVGIPTIGKGQAVEVMTGDTSSDPPAIISTFLVDGTPQGINSGFTQTTTIDGGQITTGTILADFIKGGELQLGGAANGDGVFVMLDANDDEIARIDNTAANFGTIIAGEIISPSLAAVNATTANIAYYVNPTTGSDINDGSISSPFATLQKAIDSIPRIVNHQAEIICQGTGTFIENIRVSGFSGHKVVWIKLNTCVIEGHFEIFNCTNEIWVWGQDLANLGFINAVSTGIETFWIRSTRYVELKYLRINAAFSTGAKDYALNVFASKARVSQTTLEGGGIGGAVYTEGSNIFAWETRGTNTTYGQSVVQGSTLGVQGDYCIGSSVANDFLNSAGFLNTAIAGSRSASPGGGSTPGGQTTVVLTPTATRSWRTVTNAWRTDNDRVYQGEWETFGNHRGLIFFGTQFNAFAGLTVLSAKLRIRRYDGGGSSAPQTLYLWEHRYDSQPVGAPGLNAFHGTIGTLAWGEVKTFELPASFLTAMGQTGINQARGIAFHNSGGSPYMIMNGISEYDIELEVIYQ